LENLGIRNSSLTFSLGELGDRLDSNSQSVQEMGFFFMNKIYKFILDASITKTRKMLTAMVNEAQTTLEGRQKYLADAVHHRKNFKAKFLRFCMLANWKFDF
jgi:hypothetical protein